MCTSTHAAVCRQLSARRAPARVSDQYDRHLTKDARKKKFQIAERAAEVQFVVARDAHIAVHGRHCAGAAGAL